MNTNYHNTLIGLSNAKSSASFSLRKAKTVEEIAEVQARYNEAVYDTLHKLMEDVSRDVKK